MHEKKRGSSGTRLMPRSSSGLTCFILISCALLTNIFAPFPGRVHGNLQEKNRKRGTLYETYAISMVEERRRENQNGS